MFIEFIYLILSILVFLAGITFIIFIHELGHYIFAKLFGVKVPYFAIGFGKKIYQFSKWNTEFSLRLIPIGGFVEIDQESEQAGFVRLHLFKKIVILAGGVLFNIILAFLFAFTYLFITEKSIILPNITEYDFSAKNIVVGKIVNNLRLDPRNHSYTEYKNYNDIIRDNISFIDHSQDNNVIRFLDQKDLSIKINEQKYNEVYIEVLDSTSVGINLFASDVIVSVENTPILSLEEFNEFLRENQGRLVTLQVLRHGEIIEITFEIPFRNQLGGILNVFLAQINGDRGQLGSNIYVLEYTKDIEGTFNFLSDLIGYQIKVLVYLFQQSIDTSSVQPLSDNVGSLPAVAAQTNQILKSGELNTLILLFVFINISLVIFNLLPIPALDGGQIVIETISSLSRIFTVDISKKVKSWLNYISFLFLLLFGILVILKDLGSLGILTGIVDFLNGLSTGY
jgi:regulator of sigma E protease